MVVGTNYRAHGLRMVDCCVPWMDVDRKFIDSEDYVRVCETLYVYEIYY